MNYRNLLQNISQVAIDVSELIHKYLPDVKASYLFGSFADGTANDASDLDLAILIDAKPNAEIVYTLKSEISFTYKVDVDLVDLKRADTVTCAQVVAKGSRILLRPNSNLEVDIFESTALSKYAQLNEDRSKVLDQIKKDGRVYD